jgi:hypothetical protein
MWCVCVWGGEGTVRHAALMLAMQMLPEVCVCVCVCVFFCLGV